jgi:hypothetical protein
LKLQFSPVDGHPLIPDGCNLIFWNTAQRPVQDRQEFSPVTAYPQAQFQFLLLNATNDLEIGIALFADVVTHRGQVTHQGINPAQGCQVECCSGVFDTNDADLIVILRDALIPDAAGDDSDLMACKVFNVIECLGGDDDAG